MRNYNMRSSCAMVGGFTRLQFPASWSEPYQDLSSSRTRSNAKKNSSCGVADQSFYRCLQITTSTVHRVSFYSLPRRSDLDYRPVLRNTGPGWRIKDSQGFETTRLWIRPYIEIGSESYEATISGNVCDKVAQDEASSSLHTMWHRYQL
jgi:hypothetical protein